MKKLILLIFTVFALSAYAQPDNAGKVEIYAGYGLVTAQDIIFIHSTMWTGVLVSDLHEDVVDVNGFGSVFAGFDYYNSERISFGAQLNYASYEAIYKVKSGSEQQIKIATKFYTPMLRGKVNWINGSLLQLYTTVAAGATFMQGSADNGKKDTQAAFAFHVSPVGVRLGNTFSVFAEAGFGFQGLLSAGIAIKF